jgi:hypothetical protein
MIGTNPVLFSGYVMLLSTGNTLIQVTPVRVVAAASAGATLFSTAHAVMQLPQPVHRSTSMTIP